MDRQGSSDGQLLEAFAATRDESAFEEIVHRHGLMVLNVCRRRLNSIQDAEDASQAVFLALARKAGTLKACISIAPWLHHAACCVAANLRKTRAAQLRHREQAAAMVENESELDNAQREELRQILDGELDALPEKYRNPIVLFHLEGRPLSETAQMLGCPEATVGTWLARGREVLGQRLARRGVVLSAALLSTLLLKDACIAEVPAGFAAATAKAAVDFVLNHAATTSRAAALAKGVIKVMSYSTLKVAVITAVLLLGTGAGITAFKVSGQDAPQVSGDPNTPVVKPDAVKEPAAAKERAAEKSNTEVVDNAKLASAEIVIRGLCVPSPAAFGSKGGWPQYKLTIEQVFKPKESTTLFPGSTITVIALNVHDQIATYYLVKADQYPDGYYRLIDGYDLARSSSHVGAKDAATSIFGVVHIQGGKDPNSKAIQFEAQGGEKYVVQPVNAADFNNLDGKKAVLNGKIVISGIGTKVMSGATVLKTFEPSPDGTEHDGGMAK
jgi:RNA polymerase sigma factor (sigma-70 family)